MLLGRCDDQLVTFTKNIDKWRVDTGTSRTNNSGNLLLEMVSDVIGQT